MSDDRCQRSSERSSGMACEGFGIQMSEGRCQSRGGAGGANSSVLCCEDRAATYSPASGDAVPSALRGFTVEFGMGSGGAPSPWPPGRRNRGQEPGFRNQEGGRRCRAEACSWFLVPVVWSVLADGDRGRSSSAIERLGPVSCTRCRASTSGLSTCWSCTALERDLVLRGVSRLDAFSGYLART
jgi:hypothetical protein